MTWNRWAAGTLGLLVVAALACPWLPSEGVASFVYPAISGGSVLLGWAALHRRAPARRSPWVLLLTGHSAWVAGDVLFILETQLWGSDWPAGSDILYLSGYAILAVGALQLVRSRRDGRDGTAALDAAIVTVGVAVPTVGFVLLPAAEDTTVSLLGRLVGSSYPALDLFLLAVLVRLAVTPGARTRAFPLLVGSLIATLATDAAWNIQALTVGYEQSTRWMDVGWLSGYLLIAAAALSTDMHVLTERPPHREVVPTRWRLVALAVASALPGVALLVDGLTSAQRIAWVSTGVGTVLLAVLVLMRMSGLLRQVQVQAVQLAAIARLDGLTGAPNRRTWDLELSQAVAAAEESQQPLCVALLDLDLFKRYNDTYGHQQGDRLLKEAVAAWSQALGPDRLLARYGGEEFAVLLPGHDLVAAYRVVNGMRGSTPAAQTFSGGVARWQPGTEPGAAVAAADLALYAAKRRGRDQVAVEGDTDRQELLPSWVQDSRMVVQPIVSGTDGTIVGHEALSRFPGATDVPAVFAAAYADGFGDVLELHCLQVAVSLPGRPPGTSLFVNVSAAALSSERFLRNLPSDLRDVVVELVEDERVTDWQVLAPAIADLRRRGARVAVDDLGAGAGDFTRLLAVRPDFIKLDGSIVTGCGADPARSGVVKAMLTVAHEIDAVVCAEGVETADDAQVLRALGVDLLQGYHLGRPSDRWSASYAVGTAVVPDPRADADLRSELLQGVRRPVP